MIPDVDDLYQALINAGMTESEIEHQINKKAQILGGFMSNEAILFVIAKEMGVNIRGTNNNLEDIDFMEEDFDYDDFTIDISLVEDGMSSIVIIGRIERIYPIREFTRKDGTKGIVGSFTINDGSGSIKIVLWDSQVDVMKNDYFMFNEIVRIIGGYSKMGIKDQLEVHLGKKGKIILAPLEEDVNKKIPKLFREYMKSSILDLNPIKISVALEKDGFITNISGIVHIEEFLEKISKNGEKTFLLRFYLSDDSDSIQVIAWGMDAVNCLKQMIDGDEIMLSNVIIKENSYTRTKQVHLTKKSILKKL
ncbi:MAG: hypothetical protein ACFFBP_23090 [Promethearchaeota archaeon]